MSPRILVLAAAVFFSTGGVAIKATSFSGFEVAGLRSAFAVGALIVLLPRARRRAAFVRGVVPTAIFYGLTLILFTLSNKLTTGANAIFIQDTAPLYVLLLSPFVLDERVQKSDLPFLLSVAGGLLLFFVASPAPQQTAPNPSLGNLLAVGASISFALCLIGLRWLGVRTTNDANPGGLAAIIGNLFAFVVCIPLMDAPQGASAIDWVWVAYLGIFQIGVGYALLTRAAPHVKALELSLLLLLEPVLNPIWIFAVHGEDPGLGALVGGTIVLVATTRRALRR